MTAPQSHPETGTNSGSSVVSGLLTDLTIGKKLALGMSLVLGLLVVVSGSGYLGLSEAGSNTRALSAIVQNYERIAAADMAFSQIRRNVQIFGTTGSKDVEGRIRDLQKTVVDNATLAQSHAIDPTRREMAVQLLSKFQVYMGKFDELVKAKMEDRRLVDEVVRPAAVAAQTSIESLVEAAVNEFDPASAANAGMALSHFLQQRLSSAIYRSEKDERLVKAADEQHAKAMAALSKLHLPAVSAELAKRTASVEELFDDYVKTRQGSVTRQRDLDTAFVAAEKLGDAIRVDFDALNKAQVNAENHILEKTVNAVSVSSMIMLVVSVVALGIGMLLVWLIARGIARPVQSMTAVMSRLAAGDLEVPVPATGQTNEIGQMAKAVLVFRDAAIDKIRMEREAEVERGRSEEARRKAEEEAIGRERAMVAESVGTGMAKLAARDLTYRLNDDLPVAYRRLQTDFNAAMEALEQAMEGVRTSTHEIKSGTGEIAHASVDLSRRTEGQAASLEETTAAITEITATVSKTAEGAGRARDVVATAKTDAEQGNDIMRQAVGSMGDIEQSSKEITQIIGVIDEIAFQTNLLALNAGVEAARAGDAGRGFAVVASEVRALAQRSAEAAKQIKELISKSSAQVENGVKLVHATGHALDRIVISITEINKVVTDIATDAVQQSTALGEVSSAVAQMDQVTQQNAAMVEEATAAAKTLADQTDQLASLVGEFQTTATAGTDPIRAELRKVAPHVFAARDAQPGRAREAARAGSGEGLRAVPRKPVVAKARVAAAGASANEAGWEEF